MDPLNDDPAAAPAQDASGASGSSEEVDAELEASGAEVTSPRPVRSSPRASGVAVDDGEAHAEALIGRLVDDRYKILAPMASGSMGAVFKAERVPVGKLVAVKFLHASFAKDSEFLGRFERETRVMSKLAHPNCVSVVDFGVWEGAPYLVMEFVAGTTLRAMIDEGPIPVGRALLLTRQIAAGLAHAHAQGIVHRDVKPANIMISEEIGTGDHVRILDFGLARLRGNVGRDATQTNVVVGTPNYMAPEQTIGGGTIDARTDVYAVGVVLFEMVVGERPFSADDTLALLGMHRHAPIPRLADRMPPDAQLPPGVQGLIDKAMAKAPSDRFQTAIELTEAIDALVGPRLSAELAVPAAPRSVRTDAAVASTLIDVGSADAARAAQAAERREGSAPHRAPASRRGTLGLVALAAVLVVGAGATWWITHRGSNAGSAPAAALEAGVVASVADAATPAVAPMPVPDAGIVAVVVEVDAGEGSAAQDVEIEMDPMEATNPDPIADKEAADDEAPDAPETTEAAEKLTPAAPVLAPTVAKAVELIKDGKRDLALASLNALWKRSPQSAYIPFLLGNIYNDRLWWSVAMDHYKAAINKNGKYRGNAVLNRNVIRMLASPKTQRKATAFLRTTIGKYSLLYLRTAAKSERNPTVRKQAAALSKSIR